MQDVILEIQTERSGERHRDASLPVSEHRFALKTTAQPKTDNPALRSRAPVRMSPCPSVSVPSPARCGPQTRRSRHARGGNSGAAPRCLACPTSRGVNARASHNEHAYSQEKVPSPVRNPASLSCYLLLYNLLAGCRSF